MASIQSIRWVPLALTEPDEPGPYLVALRAQKGVQHANVTLAWYSPAGFDKWYPTGELAISIEDFVGRITHWACIPKPP